MLLSIIVRILFLTIEKKIISFKAFSIEVCWFQKNYFGLFVIVKSDLLVNSILKVKHIIKINERKI